MPFVGSVLVSNLKAKDLPSLKSNSVYFGRYDPELQAKDLPIEFPKEYMPSKGVISRVPYNTEPPLQFPPKQHIPPKKSSSRASYDRPEMPIDIPGRRQITVKLAKNTVPQNVEYFQNSLHPIIENYGKNIQNDVKQLKELDAELAKNTDVHPKHALRFYVKALVGLAIDESATTPKAKIDLYPDMASYLYPALDGFHNEPVQLSAQYLNIWARIYQCLSKYDPKPSGKIGALIKATEIYALTPPQSSSYLENLLGTAYVLDSIGCTYLTCGKPNFAFKNYTLAKDYVVKIQKQDSQFEPANTRFLLASAYQGIGDSYAKKSNTPEAALKPYGKKALKTYFEAFKTLESIPNIGQPECTIRPSAYYPFKQNLLHRIVFELDSASYNAYHPLFRKWENKFKRTQKQVKRLGLDLKKGDGGSNGGVLASTRK